MQQLMDALPIRYNIAMLAPPWIPVPPDGYGGTEQVVALLCEGLVGLGHRVNLFAAPGSRSSATVYEVLPESHPNQIGESLYESDHVARALGALDQMTNLVSRSTSFMITPGLLLWPLPPGFPFLWFTRCTEPSPQTGQASTAITLGTLGWSPSAKPNERRRLWDCDSPE
jgi:hypothetical protein